MERMFGGAYSFDSDLSGWNVGRVMSMAGLFDSAEVFDRNIAGWNVLSVTSLNGASQRLCPLRRSCTRMARAYTTTRVFASAASPEDVYGRADLMVVSTM